MRKELFKYLIIVAAFLLPIAASAQRVLKYSDHEPLGNMRTKFINEVFFTAIEKESNGRLKIDAHWNSEISTGYDALSAVTKNGTADMAIIVPEYAANNLHLHHIFKGFPTGPTRDRQVEFFRKVYADIPAFPAELDKENVVNLFFATGFPVAFFSTKPLNKLQDIKGEKWRSASFWHKDFLQNTGAIPVTMPWGEGIYTAMKDGSLDGLMVNVDGGYDLKVHEIAPNILFSEDLWMGHVYLLVMNKNTWENLAQDDKDAIGRAAEIAYKSLGMVMEVSFATQIEQLKDAGANVRILAPQELEQWKIDSKYKDVQNAWVKEQVSKGVKDVGSVIEKVSTIMNEIKQ